MRVVIYGLNFWPEPTGIGKYTGDLAESLCAAGHEVRVVTAPPYYPKWRVWDSYRRCWYRSEKPSADLSVIRCPLWVPARPTGLTRLFHLISFAITSLPVILWQRFWRSDAVIVIVPTLLCVPGVLLALLGNRAKRIVHVQDLELDAAFELGLVRSRFVYYLALRAERWLLNRFDVVSSISRRMLERLNQKGIPGGKLVLLPNWVDTQEIKPGSSMTKFRFEWDLEDRVVALYSGSLGEKQGVETLLEAAGQLESQTTIRIVLCSDGPTFERLKIRYARLSNVIWRGLVPPERFNELLNTADIYLLPQRADAADLVMPSKLTGMLAGGRPVVATAAPGTQVAEVVSGRGTVVPPGDSPALAAAILSLAMDEDLRERLGATARQYAVAYLGKEAILSNFENQLRELVSQR